MEITIFLGIIAIVAAVVFFKALESVGIIGYIAVVGITLIFTLGIIFIYKLKHNKAKEEAEKILESALTKEKKAEEQKQEFLSYQKAEKARMESQKREHETFISDLRLKKDTLDNELEELNKRIEHANKELLIAETTVFETDNISSEEYKDKLAMLRLDYKEYLKSDDVIIVDKTIYASEKKKRLTDNIRQILRCFNSEAAAIVSATTASNVEKMRGSLTKAFETINSIFATDGLTLNKQLLELRLKELNLVYSYHKQKELEQEEQKAIRAQMVEEEKVRREIEREKAKLEKEESQFKNEVDKLMKYLSKSSDDVEKQLYIDKIKELEDKIKLLEKDKENVLQREQNTRAGFVYIISNIGSFGENIYKIGMTRRLEPMDRVKELGDASVPFEFDVHAMIFSEDAPTLETTLHNTFKNHQVNLVNPRKEFYNVSLDEIEKVVKESYNATVTFTHIAEAAQYRESVKIRETMA